MPSTVLDTFRGEMSETKFFRIRENPQTAGTGVDKVAGGPGGTGAHRSRGKTEVRSAGEPWRKDGALVQALKARRPDRLTDGGEYSMDEGPEVGRSASSLGKR